MCTDPWNGGCAKPDPQSFCTLMLSINGDAGHPVELSVGRNQREVFVDSFDSEFSAGQQELDLADIAKLPFDPPPGFPDAATQGEVLAHALAEAQAGAKGDDYEAAQDIGIKAQNDYRDDRHQQGHRQHDAVEHNTAGNWTITYDNGYWEVWVRSQGAGISGVDRHAGIPPTLPAHP